MDTVHLTTLVLNITIKGLKATKCFLGKTAILFGMITGVLLILMENRYEKSAFHISS